MIADFNFDVDHNSQSNNNDEYGDELDQANYNKKIQFDLMLTFK